MKPTIAIAMAAAPAVQARGKSGDVIEKCLNHTEQSKIKRIYQREQYAGPMRDAWRVWGAHLELLQAQSRGEAKNVVRLHA